MKVTVRYFASIREAAGKASESIDTAAATVAALRDELVSRGAGYAQALARGKSVRASLDKVMSDESAPLREGCEVGFFPPVTGG